MFAKPKTVLLLIGCLLLIANAVGAEPFWSMTVGEERANTKNDSLGNSWVVKMNVMGTQVFGDREYYHIHNVNYENDGAVSDVYIRSTDTATYQYNVKVGAESMGFQIGPVGTTWNYPHSGSSGGTRYSEITSIETVTVPYGTFPTTYVVRNFIVNSGGTSPSWYDYWAPVYGYIKAVDYWTVNAPTTESLTGIAINAAASYFDTVQKVYIAYYGRPSDPGGLIWWAGKLHGVGGNLSAIMDSYGNSAEATNLHAGQTTEQLVNSLYQQMFNRDAESAGLAYWVGRIDDGSITLPQLALVMLNAAQNEDRQSVNNKLAAAYFFTEAIDPELDGSNFQVTYAGDGDATAGRNFLALYATAVKVPTKDETTAYIKAIIANTGDAIFNR